MTAMPWSLSWAADPTVRHLADRHYSRQTIGSDQFAPPGPKLVLHAPGPCAWVTLGPQRYVRHDWPGAWLCTLFRREGGPYRASDLIRAAIAASRWKWPTVPPLGMVTFIDPAKVRHKRDPGRCFLRAGFRRDGTTRGGLIALRLWREDFPEAAEPLGAQLELAR